MLARVTRAKTLLGPGQEAVAVPLALCLLESFRRSAHRRSIAHPDAVPRELRFGRKRLERHVAPAPRLRCRRTPERRRLRRRRQFAPYAAVVLSGAPATTRCRWSFNPLRRSEVIHLI